MTDIFKLSLTYLMTLALSGLILGCKQATTSATVTPAKASTDLVIDEAQAYHPSVAVSVDSIKVLPTVDRKVFPFNGQFLSATTWLDRLGDNVLVISEKGEYEEGNGRKEIFANHYIKVDTAYNRLWQMNDFVDGWGCDLDIQLLHFFPLVTDVDANGIAETAIFYSLNSRCDASTLPAKIIVHEGMDKFAIRGMRAQYLGPPEDVINTYRQEDGLPPIKYKDVDANTSKMDSSIVNYYTQQWDDFIRLENEQEGNLPDSLVTLID